MYRKTKNFTISIILVSTNLCLAQHRNLSSDTLLHRIKVMYILNFPDKMPVMTENAVVDPQKVEGMDNLLDSGSVNIANLLHVSLISVLKIKRGTRLLTLNEVFNSYSIPPQCRSWPIKLDDEVIDYPETLFISQNQIDNVIVVKQGKNRFVRIILKGYLEIKKEKKKNEVRMGNN